MSAEYLSFKDPRTGEWVNDAIVVHLTCGPSARPLKACTGEEYDAESTVDLSNTRVFCEACRLAACRS